MKSQTVDSSDAEMFGQTVRLPSRICEAGRWRPANQE